MVPTKGDSLSDRMIYTFGRQRIRHSFENMITAYGCDLLDYLTDEARDELIRRCIVSHKLQRRFATQSRKLHQERKAS